MRLWLAIRAFFAVLFRGHFARDVQRLLSEDRAEMAAPEAPQPETKKPQAEPAVKPPPARSEAITLLAALQREARFVDIVKEPLGDYSDQQIGAAARDVLRDCGAVLDRMFALEGVVDEAEGAELEVPAGFDPGRYRLTGNVAGDPPFRGKLVHHGWRATRCELPQWSGSAASALVVAPVELEIR